MAKRLKAKDYIKAIEGSGANISEIARRLHCHRDTVSRAIGRLKSVADAMEKEKESLIDEAQFGVSHNIRVRNETARKDNEPINAIDHKWWLSRMKPNEFGDRLDITSGNKPLLEVSEDKIGGYIERLEELTTILANPDRVHSSEQDN
jgi:IS30 family transposase